MTLTAEPDVTNRKARRAAAKGTGPKRIAARTPLVSVQSCFAAASEALNQGRSADAADLFYQVLEADPDHAESLLQLGVLAHRAAQFDIAQRFFLSALGLDPRSAVAHLNLGLARIALGEGLEAQASFRHAIVCNPKLPEAHLALSHLLHAEGRLDEAAEGLKTALKLRPNYAPALLNLGNVLREQGRLTAAEASLRSALELEPDSALAWRALAVVAQEQGLVDVAIDSFDRALALAPAFVEAQSGRLFCLNYDPARSSGEIASAHRLWGVQTAPPAPPARRATSERLRIGYVSADFHRHPVGFFFSGVIQAHDKSKVEIFCYANGDRRDEVENQIRAAADHWRAIKGLTDEAVESMVRADGIDILVDLSGHTTSNRLCLFQRRPAPVQASWLGYVNTTGLRAMDFLVTDAVTAPPGSEQIYTETLIRLAHGRFCYTPPTYAPDPGPSPSSLGQAFTFGSFNDLLKVGPAVIEAWAAILCAAPGARLILKWKALDDEGVRTRILAAFSAQGIEGKRLDLRGHSPHPKMLWDYHDVDLALDPFPFGGGVTTCEALWMGVPVLTLPQDRPASRQSLAFLQAVGLSDLAAVSLETYIALAAGLAADPARLAILRRGLRNRMEASILCRPELFTPHLEAAFDQMWRS